MTPSLILCISRAFFLLLVLISNDSTNLEELYWDLNSFAFSIPFDLFFDFIWADFLLIISLFTLLIEGD